MGALRDHKEKVQRELAAHADTLIKRHNRGSSTHEGGISTRQLSDACTELRERLEHHLTTLSARIEVVMPPTSNEELED